MCAHGPFKAANNKCIHCLVKRVQCMMQFFTKHRNAFAKCTLYRVSRIAGTPVFLKAEVIGENEIEVQVTPAEGGNAPSGPIVEAALRRKFSLDLDLPAFYAFLAAIPQLRGLADNHRGLRPILKDTLLEALSLAIADQQVNVAFAAELKQRLLSTYGKC